MIENYLNILEDSLKKKIDVLKRIQAANEIQTTILKKEPVDLEAFDKTVDEKDLYIEELTSLDDGFESLYEKVKQELDGNRSRYAEQIKRMQGLIADITDRSVAIQAQEARNKALVENCFKVERQNLGKSRKNSKAAYGYYQNMNNKNVPQSHFMDQKK
ncbi:MAG: flagellar protein FliT [Lachnospiraceae bacterium]|nr:flagellar protein FliT [Lachnospiraceae bacterium]MDE6185605.1 flagellar protein FliT [Lachnospiraceae bacterium]MDE7286337.1 flagellar protein FliT [Lachnospiraceae bacterium]